MIGACGALAAAVEAHAGAGVPTAAILVIGCSVAAAAGAVETRADDGAPGGDVEGAAVGVEGFAGDVELFVFV